MKKILILILILSYGLSFGQLVTGTYKVGKLQLDTPVSTINTLTQVVVRDSITRVTKVMSRNDFLKGVSKSNIKSNESLSLASRNGDVLYGILDQYTGEQITLSKVTGTPTVDGIIYFQLGSEYFKRNDITKYNAEWWGLSTTNTSANNTIALQTAIDLVISLDNPALIERKAIEISLPLGDIQLGNINFKGSISIRGKGRTSTRIYYNGNDYLFKGNTANIQYGGIYDLTMISNNALNKGFIYMINHINMTFDNINCNASVFGSQILEHSIKLESKFSWFVGANNNFFNTKISNFTIKGGAGNGIHITGDYGSAQTIIHDGVIEAMGDSPIHIASTDNNFSHSNISVKDVILQGYASGCGIELYNCVGFEFKGYIESIISNPAIILGGTKYVRNVYVHHSNIGCSVGFGGVLFKSGAGISFSNTNVVYEDLNITTTNSSDILTDLACSNTKIKNIQVNNAVNLNTFTAYDRELGNYEVDLGNTIESGLTPKETLYNCPIPNGMISYFRGASLIDTSIRRQKNILGGADNLSQFDINTDIYINDRTYIYMGNKNNYYPKKHNCYRIINTDLVKTINFTVSSGTINGLASFDVLPGDIYDVTFDGNSDFLFLKVSASGITPTLQQVSDAGKTVNYPDGVDGMVLTLDDTIGNGYSALYVDVIGSGTAIIAASEIGNSITASSVDGYGINASSTNNIGIRGVSTNSYGIYGEGLSIGIHGNSNNGIGIYGNSNNGAGIYGNSVNAVASISNIQSGNTSNISEFKNSGIIQTSISHDGIITSNGVISNGTIRLKAYTVATLPTGIEGDTAYVTDALAPSYLVTVVGGGAIKTAVFFNGTNWVSH